MSKLEAASPRPRLMSFGCAGTLLLALAFLVVLLIVYLIAGGNIGWWNPFYKT